MPNITIELSDLERIMARLFDLDVTARTNLAILNRRAASDPQARAQHVALFRELKPKASEDTLPRYQKLIDAFEAKDGAAVQRLLPNFARRESN